MKKILKVGYFVLAITAVVFVKTTLAAREPANLCERWISLSTCTLVGTSGPGTYFGCLTSTSEWCCN